MTAWGHGGGCCVINNGGGRPSRIDLRSAFPARNNELGGAGRPLRPNGTRPRTMFGAFDFLVSVLFHRRPRPDVYVGTDGVG